jgi:hypothetical protein
MEKLRVGFDTKTELYLIPRKNNIVVNDKDVELQYSSTTSLVTSVKPEKVQTYSNISKITHYEKDSEVLSVDDYNTKIDSLRDLGDWDEDNEFVFSCADNEIKWKHLIKDWKAVSITQKVFTEYEIEIFNVPVSEYSCIRPIAHLDDIVSVDKGLFNYTVDAQQLFKEYCVSVGLCFQENKSWGGQDVGTFSWSHSGLDYAKISNEYVYLGEKPRFYGVSGSYAECVKRLELHKDEIKKAVDLMINKKDKEKMTELERGIYYKTLDNIYSSIKSLSVNKKSYQAQTALLNSIKKKLEDRI